MGNTNLKTTRSHPYLRTWVSNSFDDESEQDPLSIYYNNLHHRNSGTGILEFSAAKAGQDVTPANYYFSETKKSKKKNVGNLSLADALSSVTNLAFSTTQHHNHSTSVHSDDDKNSAFKEQLKNVQIVNGGIDNELLKFYVLQQNQIVSKIEKLSE